MEPRSIKFPPPLLRALDRIAAREGSSRSALIREAVMALCRERGEWPPTTAVEAAEERTT